jgi:alpha-galactosidase
MRVLSIIFASVLAGHALADVITLRTDDTRIELHVERNTLRIEKLLSVRDGQQWIAPQSFPLIPKVWVGDRERTLEWQFEPVELAPDQATFTFACTDPKLTLRSIWRARPGRGPIEHWVEIENQSTKRITIPQQESLALSVGVADPFTTRLWWIKRGGSNATTQGGVFNEPFGPRDLVLASNPEDGASPIPWLAVQGEKGGLYVGWKFSGLGRIQATIKQHLPLVGIRVGLHADFKTDIGPGETFIVPPAFIGCYAGDIDEGAYSLHRFIIEKLRPRVPKGYADPTLAYNLYLDAGGNKATEADVLRSAATCHDLGFETFMPDAMWFPETGDWRWDPKRFPRGIDPIERAVHGEGMKLALWCAWTNGGVSSHRDALSVRGPIAHPDWFRSDVPKDWQPGAFSGAQLCLGCDEAKNWAIAKTQWLVAHHKLDYLKHDISPIVTSCQRTDHRHHFGTDASYWATMGYYAVQEKLLASNPNLMLENCSGGGQIKDFGILSRTHYTVATDTLSNLPDRQAIYDSTYCFPPILLQAYTYDRVYPVKGDDPGAFLWRSGMMSAWQIDPTDTDRWTEGERDITRRHTQIYKEWIRPMLQDVKVHHILPRPDGVHWDGMFYFSEPTKRGMLYIFRPDATEDQQTVRLKGLDTSKRYWIWGEDASVAPAQRTGGELMRDGVAVSLPTRYSSDLIYLQEASLGRPKDIDPPGEFALSGATVEGGPFSCSAKLNWQPSASARSYHIIVSIDADLHDPIVDMMTTKNAVIARHLPAARNLFWKVQAISPGGRRDQTGARGEFKTPPLKKLDGVTFLSEIDWLKSNAGAGNPVHRDTNLTGGTIRIAHKTYEKGIWTHSNQDDSPADVVIDIANKPYERFIADAGVEDSSGGGSVQFQVLMDGQVKGETPVMRADASYHFDLDISGAKQITLRVLNGGDGYACDHAAWGCARFIDRGNSDPVEALILGVQK